MIKWILLTMSLLTINVANAQYKYDESVAEFLRQCQTYSNDILALSDKEMLLNVFDTISVEKSFIKKLNANIEYGITVYLKDEQEKIDIKVYKKEAGKWKNIKAKFDNNLGFQTIGFFTPSTPTTYKIVLRKKQNSLKPFNYYFLEFYANYEQ